jgi:hypothetical protein
VLSGAWSNAPKGQQANSPGQRPGYGSQYSFALKGQKHEGKDKASAKMSGYRDGNQSFWLMMAVGKEFAPLKVKTNLNKQIKKGD